VQSIRFGSSLHFIADAKMSVGNAARDAEQWSEAAIRSDSNRSVDKGVVRSASGHASNGVVFAMSPATSAIPLITAVRRAALSDVALLAPSALLVWQ
jgi:hypothetical protein